MSKRYRIIDCELGDSSKFEPKWSNMHLDSYGHSLNDLIDNGTVTWCDQDGGELLVEDARKVPEAVKYIYTWWVTNAR